MPGLRRLQERLPALVHIGDQGLTTHTGCRLKRRKRGERIDIGGHTAGLSQQRRIAIKAELVRYVLPFALFDRILLRNADGVLNADAGHMRELALKRVGLRIIDVDRHRKRHGGSIERNRGSLHRYPQGFSTAHTKAGRRGRHLALPFDGVREKHLVASHPVSALGWRS